MGKPTGCGPKVRETASQCSDTEEENRARNEQRWTCGHGHGAGGSEREPGSERPQMKKNKRRPACMDPEQADRLKNLQMSLLQQIPLVDFAFWHHNESDFVRALDSVVVDKKSLREYYFREDRLGDILFFSKDTLPRFAKE